MTIDEWLDSQKISYTKSDDVYNIPEFGKILYVDFSKKKSIYREFDNGEEKKIFLNIFDTAEELIADDINYVMFQFGSVYNYVDIRGNALEMIPLANIGKVKLSESFDFDYVNLGVHTGMEILNGSGSLSSWIKRAKFLNHKHLGVCDFNTMGSLLNLQKECKDSDINPVFGYSTKLAFNFSSPETIETTAMDIKLYAKSNLGLSSLLRIQKSVMVDTGFNKESPDLANDVLLFDDLKKFRKDIIIVLGVLSMDFIKNNSYILDELISIFEGNIYYQIDFNEYKANRIDMIHLESLKYFFDNIYKKKNISPILIPDSYYVNSFESNNKYILNLISRSNVSHAQSDQQWYKDIEDIKNQMVDIMESYDPIDIIKESANNTVVVAESCKAEFNMHKNFMPQYDLTEEEREKYGNAINMFDELLEEGFRSKTPAGKENLYRERLEMERYVIKSTNNVDYMLNQYDVVNFAESNDIMVGAGRGSAGGSLILYFLGVTKIDPIRFNLLFERFLLPERAGLYEAQTTKIDEYVNDSEDVYEITLDDGRCFVVDEDSQILTKDGDRALYPDELKNGDELIFDNIHNLFDLDQWKL